MKKKQPIRFRVLDAIAQSIYHFREVTLLKLNNYFDRQAGRYWVED